MFIFTLWRWKGIWATDFKKDKDTNCTCNKKEKFHFRLVFEKKSDYEKVVEFFEKKVKSKKTKTRRSRSVKKEKSKRKEH